MRTSERMSGKVIPLSSLREKKNIAAVKQPPKLRERNYCCECPHRKRGNTWELDYCRKLKKLCKIARMGGQFAIAVCKSFGDLDHGEKKIK